ATDFLGISAETPAPAELLHKIPWLIEHASFINPATVAIAIACTLLIHFWPRFGYARVPGSIVAMVLATGLVAIFGWENSAGVATVGSRFGPDAIPHGLP